MKKIVLLAGAAALLASGCVSRADIEEIKKNQKEILTKIEKSGRAAPAKPAAARPGRPDPSKVYSFDVGDSHTKGNKDAWVTVIEVSDFQCPYCKRVGPSLKQLEEKYGKEVRFAFKHNALSFHKRAKPAAMASECAGEQGKFWEMHDALFENQRQLEDADLEKYAKNIGVDVAKWKSCVADNKFTKKIDADQRNAVALGARGTPAFFINGRYLSGAQPFDKFDALVQEEMKKAKASGVPAAKYYSEKVVKTGQKKI